MMTDAGLHALIERLNAQIALLDETPADHYPNPNSQDPLQQKLDQLLSGPPPKLKGLDPKFRNLPDFLDLKPVSTDFPDDKLLSQKSVILQFMTDREIVQLGRLYLPMLASGFSPRGVGALFQMAYNLRDPRNPSQNALPDASNLFTKNDIQLVELPGAPANRGLMASPLSPLTNESEEAKAYAFISASALRLFTKPEQSYIQAFNRICAGCQKFHGSRFPVSSMNLTVEALRTLKIYFHQNPVFKSTFYRILYLGGGTKNAEGLRRFLYEIHLSGAGMHIISVFVRLCEVLDCDPEMVLEEFPLREFSRQVDALRKVMELTGNQDDEHKRGMWKYGRIFDETFMSPLQTKACPRLVCIFASALKSEAPENNQDILNIAQLENVSPEERKRCEKAGLVLVEVIKKHQAEMHASEVKSDAPGNDKDITNIPEFRVLSPEQRNSFWTPYIKSPTLE